MSFLGKFGKKKKDVAPPPPPPSAKQPVQAHDPKAPLPPMSKPGESSMPKSPGAPQMPPPPTSKGASPSPQMPPPPAANPAGSPQMPMPPTTDSSASQQPAPNQGIPKPPAIPTKAPEPKPQAPQQPPPTREEIRKQMADVPPISVEPGHKDVITDQKVHDLDVDSLVMPKAGPDHSNDQPRPAKPALKEAPKPMEHPHPHPMMQRSSPPSHSTQPEHGSSAFSGPLYVDVQTYESIQKAVGDLKNQLDKLHTDVEDIYKVRETEEKDFNELVKKLEKVQDDLLEVDQSLFEER